MARFLIVAVPLVTALTGYFGTFAHDVTDGRLPVDYSRALMATIFLGLWVLLYLMPNSKGGDSGGSGCGSSCGGGCGGD